MDPVSLKTSPRTALRKKVKALRRSGVTPLHLYGLTGGSLSLQAPSSEVRKVIMEAGRTSPVYISVEGESEETLSFIRDVAVHPVTGEIQHVDFLRIQADQRIEVPVSVVLVGEAPATIGGAAQINQITRTLMVLAYPLDAPSVIEGDISGLEEIGDVLRISDLNLPTGVEPSTHGEDVIARAAKQREIEVFEIVGAEAVEGEEDVEGIEVEEGEEGAEGAEAAEGQDAADGDSDESK
ncbi:MAG: 50S ribosomal protein L25 [Chloroflexi bacterium]|nr:50S ribosomal protein L25 [Chloroflexota bacterium]